MKVQLGFGRHTMKMTWLNIFILQKRLLRQKHGKEVFIYMVSYSRA